MRIFLATFLSILFLLGNCQSDTVLVSHLSASWLDHDENSQLVQSFDDEDNQTGGFFLLKEEMNDNILKFCGDEYHIWLEGKMITPSSNGCKFFQVADFFQSYEKDTLYFVVSAESLVDVDVNLMSVSNSAIKLFDEPTPFQANYPRQFFLVVSIIIMLSLVILRRIDNQAFSSLTNFSFVSKKLEAEEGSSTASTNVILLVLLAVLLAFLKTFSSTLNYDLIELLSSFILAFGFIVVFIVAKFLLLGTITRLFRFKRIEANQFRNYLFFLASSLLVLFMLEVFIFWIQDSTSQLSTSLLYLGLIVNILFIVWMYFKLRNHQSRRKLHIISYLCSTEILPTFVLANWLLN